METVKLVDILARELKVWPEDCEAIEQDRRGSCLFKVNGPAISTYVEAIAEDADTAKVTRAQWQAEVDALKAAENIASAWNGEGFPPIGVDALLAKECKFTEGTRLESFPAGTVVYVGGRANFGGCDLAVIIIKGRHFCGTIIPELLNPIRTPEQIEAEEREQDAQALFELINPEGKWHKFAEEGKARFRAAVAAGYRKQVAP